MDKIKTDLNQIRLDIDVLISMGNQISRSRETSLAFTKLQEGRMHVGNALFELGGVTPYNSKDPKDKTIDPYYKPEALVPMEVPVDWNESDIIANLKILRREIEAVRKRLLVDNIIIWAMTYTGQAVVRLREAENWYGMELGRIRDTQTNG